MEDFKTRTCQHLDQIPICLSPEHKLFGLVESGSKFYMNSKCGCLSSQIGFSGLWQ